LPFSLLKNVDSVKNYGAHIARFVLSLLRELDEGGDDKGVITERDCSDIFTDTSTEDDGDMDAHQDLLFLAADLEDDGNDEFEFEDDGEDLGDSEDDEALEVEDVSDVEENDAHFSHDNIQEKRYPILFTEEQRAALRRLYCGLQDGKADESLLALFHDVSLAIFTTQRNDAERCRFHLPLDSFIISYNLRKDRSFRKPVSIAPGVSILQYWAQFTVLHDAMRSGQSVAEYATSFSLIIIAC
jgi:hypothetical protein